MKELFANPLISKLIISLIPLIIKEVIKHNRDLKKSILNTLTLFNFLIPISVIIWLNIDCNVVSSKFTTTLIAFNFFIILFNLLLPKVNTQNQTISKFIDIENDKVKQVNHINEVQVEKMKAIVSNQEYILSEISRINDRIMNLIFHFDLKKKK